MSEVWKLAMLPWHKDAAFCSGVDGEVHIRELKSCMSDGVTFISRRGAHGVHKLLEHGKKTSRSSTDRVLIAS
jgi:hypothetical protein